ncbi:zinc ribbon domain-containing protein [Candidatus Sumerlaeota bacterium]|nr:zinc ribbon domain-containing protein [Candidatus Sumerlaeota bacterium]
MGNICPHCQMEIPKGKFICPICGIDIRDWAPDKLRCPICRSLYPSGTKFCLKDGSPLEQAIVNFDTEATIFLSGSVKTKAPREDDIIPKLKFQEEDKRAFPKLERDEKGHIAPPPPPPKPRQVEKKEPLLQTFTYDPPGEPEMEMPEITIDPVPHARRQMNDSDRPVSEPPKDKTPVMDPFPTLRSDVKTPSKGSHLRVKPLEEYERLLREEKEKIAAQIAIQMDHQRHYMQGITDQRPGFFKRLITAIRVLMGK